MSKLRAKTSDVNKNESNKSFSNLTRTKRVICHEIPTTRKKRKSRVPYTEFRVNLIKKNRNRSKHHKKKEQTKSRTKTTAKRPSSLGVTRSKEKQSTDLNAVVSKLNGILIKLENLLKTEYKEYNAAHTFLTNTCKSMNI